MVLTGRPNQQSHRIASRRTTGIVVFVLVCSIAVALNLFWVESGAQHLVNSGRAAFYRLKDVQQGVSTFRDTYGQTSWCVDLRRKTEIWILKLKQAQRLVLPLRNALASIKAGLRTSCSLQAYVSNALYGKTSALLMIRR